MRVRPLLLFKKKTAMFQKVRSSLWALPNRTQAIGGTEPPGPVNLFEGLTFSGPNWVDEGGGVYSNTGLSATAELLSPDDFSYLVEGNTYTFIYNLDSSSSCCAFARVGGTNTSYFPGAPEQDIARDIVCGSSLTATGIQNNAGARGIVVSNLRLYAV